jgi:hypothetical protein
MMSSLRIRERELIAVLGAWPPLPVTRATDAGWCGGAIPAVLRCGESCGHPGCTGGHLLSNVLYKHFHSAREAAGRPDLGWHDLRHTGAVWAAQTGATLAELMARLGHSTVSAAMRYSTLRASGTPRLPAACRSVTQSDGCQPGWVIHADHTAGVALTRSRLAFVLTPVGVVRRGARTGHPYPISSSPIGACPRRGSRALAPKAARSEGTVFSGSQPGVCVGRTFPRVSADPRPESAYRFKSCPR